MLKCVDDKYSKRVIKALYLIIHIPDMTLQSVLEGIAPINDEGYINWDATFLDPKLLFKETGIMLMGAKWYSSWTSGDNDYKIVFVITPFRYATLFSNFQCL
jgi:hypothetical protein